MSSADVARQPKVAITWPVDDAVIAHLREHAQVAVNRVEKNLTADELRGLVKGAEAILCLLTNKITAEVLDAAGPGLKIVATMSVGYDHIDLKAAQARGVTIANTPGTLDNAVAEHTVALMLGLAKSLIPADAYVHAGKYRGWDPKLFVGPELNGKILGIVGLGHIGSTVAKIAGFGLGMAIGYNDLKPNRDFEHRFNARYFSLDHLLQVADVVTLHVPLLPSTRHLINAERLALMKPTAFLINTARGAVVDEAALASALSRGAIAGAGIDVFEHEPDVTLGLKSLTNVIMTPHTGSATREARLAMAQKAAANILAVLKGRTAPDVVLLQD